MERNIPGTLLDSGAWGTANNHFLNSLAIEINSSIFGQGDLIMRLQSILAFIIYGVAAIFIVNKIYYSIGAMILASSFIFFNVYLIDFFSLARGYGMSVGFQMAGIAFLIAWFSYNKNKFLWLAFGSIALASLSLFTHLIFFPVYAGTLWIHEIFIKKTSNTGFNISVFYIPILIGIITGIVVYVPITTLSENSEFLWGASSLSDTLARLTKDSLQGRYYFGPHTVKVIAAILMTGIFLGVYFLVKKNKNEEASNTSFHLFLLISFFLLISIMVVSKFLFGTLYPIERKSTLLLPLLFLLIPFGIDYIKKKRISLGTGSLISIVLIMHFVDKLEMERTREWYYDYKTKDYIDIIAHESEGKKVNIINHWTFHWTSVYYIRTKGYSNLSVSKYQDIPNEKDTPEYYIIHNKNYHLLSESYDIIDGPNKSMVLLLKAKD